MITDLTALDIANASLLDEATAAAEAMALCHAVVAGPQHIFRRRQLSPANDRGRANTRQAARHRGLDRQLRRRFKFDETVFGALVQYPATDGAIYDYAAFIKQAHEAGALVVVAADILALTLLKPPGEFGADVAVGNTQRFGVPLGFGGPHAAYFATRDNTNATCPDGSWAFRTMPRGDPLIDSRCKRASNTSVATKRRATFARRRFFSL